MPDISSFVDPGRHVQTAFKPVHLLLVVFTALLLIFYASRWYATQVSLPRYCQHTEQVLQRLAAINTETRPAGEKSRRNYIVAAKLEFLMPAMADEGVDAYLKRLKMHFQEQCG